MNRYSRQTLLPHIGEKGQRKLQDAKITVIGSGALGSTIAEHAVRAGIGSVCVVDRDFVELTNLQRQHLFSESDIGEPKAVAAEEKLKSINSEIEITGIVQDVNSTNVEKIIGKSDIVLDGTDNLTVRYLINDACNNWKIPWIYGACVGVNGMTMDILPEGPCLLCLLPQVPPPGSIPSCDTVGIINTLPTIVGALEFTKALKYLVGETLRSQLTIIDVWELDFKTIEVSRRKDCPCCVDHTYEFLNTPQEKTTVLCGRDAVQVNPLQKGSILLSELAERLEPLGEVKQTPHLLIFSADHITITLFPDGRAIVKGTNDEKEAKSLYAKYVGF